MIAQQHQQRQMPRQPTPAPHSVAPATGAARAMPSDVLLFDELDAVLRDLLKEHQQLLELTTEHRRAISHADAPALNTCIGRQSETVLRIAALEKKRQQVVSKIAAARPELNRMSPKTVNNHTISTLLMVAPESVRVRISGVSKALRDLLNALHRENLALRQAAETLSSHMEGLMRQVCQRLSHAGTYARSGSIDSSVQVVSSFDVRT